MRRFSILIAAILSLCAGSPGLAAEKGARPPAAPPTAADSRLMAELVQSGAPYQALVLSSETFLNQVLIGGKTILGADTPPSASDVVAWKVQVLAAQARIRAERAALPAFPSSRFAVLRPDPDGARLLTALEMLPKVSGDVADNILDLTDKIVPLVERAAAGDKPALEELRLVIMDGSIAALRAENALLGLSIAMSGEGQPQTALSRSMIASNDAVGDFYQMMGAVDDDAKLRPLAVKMVADLNEAESQAKKIGPLAKFALSRVDSSFSPDLKRRITAAFATYDESAQVELQLVALVRQIMGKLAEDPQAAMALTQEAGPLVTRRIELQNQRTRAFGGA